MKLTKTPTLVFIAIVDRPPGSNMQTIEPISQYGVEAERHWVAATRLFTCPDTAETYRVQMQRRLDAEMNDGVVDSTSHYKALTACMSADVDVVGPE